MTPKPSASNLFSVCLRSLGDCWCESCRPLLVPEAVADTCEICGRGAASCRFEVGCSCWRGKPCNGSGRVSRRKVAR